MDAGLYIAARTGHVQTLIDLADEDALDSTAPQRNTILHIAARAGHVEFVKEILARRISLIMQANEKGDTPLHCAARTGQLSVVELLITWMHPTSLKTTNNKGNTVLMEAITNYHEPVVMKLLEINLPVDVSAEPLEEKKALVQIPDSSGRNVFHHAARQDNETIASRLLSIDPLLPYVLDKSGCSPLHIAAASNSEKVFLWLVKTCPCAIEQLDPSGKNAIHIAVVNGWFRLVQNLGNGFPDFKGAIEETDEEEGNTLLHLAVIHRNLPLADWILREKMVDSMIRNKDGHTARDLLELREFKDNIQGEMRRVFKTHGAVSLEELSFKRIHVHPLVPEEHYREHINSLTLMATLVTTVTFSATFTMPGGYSSSNNNEGHQGGSRDGSATLMKMAAFKVFLLSCVVSMSFSLTAIVLFICATHFRAFGTRASLKFADFWGNWFNEVALRAMLVSMAAGVYAVVAPDCLWLAIAVCIIASTPIITFVFVFFHGVQDMQYLRAHGNSEKMPFFKALKEFIFLILTS